MRYKKSVGDFLRNSIFFLLQRGDAHEEKSPVSALAIALPFAFEMWSSEYLIPEAIFETLR